MPFGAPRAKVAAVGLNTADVLGKYPHQLSGGQLQRLMTRGRFCSRSASSSADEVISMLDASTRVDVLNLLADLKARGLAILFITHDLSLGNYISERTMILRRGRIVELGPTERSSAIRGIRTRRRSSPRFRSWPVEVTTGSEDSAALVDVGGGHLVALFP